MLLGDLDFDFPEELIAQRPVVQRDSCRLMYLSADQRLEHRHFRELPDLLLPGDLLVFNDSRVLPARVKARKITGGEVELLFVRPVGIGGAGSRGEAGSETWEALARPSHRLRPGMAVFFPGGEEVVLRELLGEGRWLLDATAELSMLDLMDKYGRLPLPPYIKEYPADPTSYQTVYAARPGSAAAPTAGLHFTPALLEALAGRGVASAFVTLHVGLDTFQPIRERVVEDHRIHTEAYSVTAQALAAISEARTAGGRVVAVGTTATRVLETLAAEGLAGTELSAENGGCEPQGSVSGSTNIFITPGYSFKVVDSLLTNFHLPRSSVLALTMAFAGVDAIRRAYAEAIAQSYRFFSFGDAMLVERLGVDRRACS